MKSLWKKVVEISAYWVIISEFRNVFIYICSIASDDAQNQLLKQRCVNIVNNVLTFVFYARQYMRSYFLMDAHTRPFSTTEYSP